MAHHRTVEITYYDVVGSAWAVLALDGDFETEEVEVHLFSIDGSSIHQSPG